MNSMKPKMTKEPVQHIYSVSELTFLIKEILESEFPKIMVEGEISGYKVSPSGHAYFRLKDQDAVLDGVLWKHKRQQIPYPIEDGMLVIVTGSISLYAPQGRYQMVVDRLEPAGLGELQRRFELLKEKLKAEGLFDSGRKKPIPSLPEKIGIVTSLKGAAIRDFLKIIKTGFPGGFFQIFGTRVQGKEAPPEIASAIGYFNMAKKVDLIILTRGGGSLEDLWAFNEEVVARAIAKSEIPIISAVGHEIDFTISDFVADLRLPTPTAAASFIVQNREAAWNELCDLRYQLAKALEGAVKDQRQRFALLQTQLQRLSPVSIVAGYRQKIDDRILRMISFVKNMVSQNKNRVGNSQTQLPKALNSEIRRVKITLSHKLERLAFSVKNIKNLGKQKIENSQNRLPLLVQQNLREKKVRVIHAIEKLQTLNPQKTLARGYAICKDENGKAVTDPTMVAVGDRLEIRVDKGSIPARVTAKDGSFQDSFWKD